MHFAQTLEASTIPEWKSQYVDFKQGKKLISKLEKQLSSVQPQINNWDLPPPASSSYAHNNGPSTSSSSGRQHTGSIEPPPAYGRPIVPPSRVINDRSPLLATPNTRLYETPDPQSQSVRQNAQQQTPQPPSTQPLESEEEVRRAVRRKFFAWVSEQTTKASSFYSTMLEEAETKLAVLDKQFVHFDMHRREHQEEKKKANPQQQATSSLFRSLDLPSLPEVFKTSLFADSWRHPRQHHRIARVAAHTSDFNNRDDHVGYYQAKSMLRSSLINFFQFLSQLREFRQLNQTAIRKIIKKFDKQSQFRTLDRYMDETQNMSLRSSERLDAIIMRVESSFANEFTKGNHKLAVDSLRARFLQEERPENSAVMFSGFTLGASVPLIILGLWAALRHQYTHPAETNYLLQMYGAFALIGLMLVGFGVCLLYWSHYRINYPFILDLDRATMLDYRQFLVSPGMYVLGLGLFGWLSFNTVQDFHRYYPCSYLAIAVAVSALPTKKHVQGYSRWWLLHSLWRLLLSGLYPVEFRDLMMGDLTCSLTYSLSTLESFFCVYATPHWWSGAGAEHAKRCTSSRSRALGFLNCLPGIWRFMQCWRRYADTLDWFPHLSNAGKYSFNILYNMSSSLARISPHHTGLKAMFIVFALINGVYSGIWDVLMDFSLVPAKQPRDVLVYPRWSYFAAMFSDSLMRQNWVLYVIFWNHKAQGAMISFVVALIEASRRIIWLAFRVENEHAANISRCRAFKELSLPYDDSVTGVTGPHDAETASSSDRSQNNDATARLRRPATFNAGINAERNAERSDQRTQPSNEPRRPKHANTFMNTQTPMPKPPSRHTPSPASKSPSLSPFALSPRSQFAHTADFQKRKPPVRDAEEDEDEEDEEEADIE